MLESAQQLSKSDSDYYAISHHSGLYYFVLFVEHKFTDLSYKDTS